MDVSAERKRHKGQVRVAPGEEDYVRRSTVHSGHEPEQLPHSTRVLAKGRRKRDHIGVSKLGEECHTINRSNGGRSRLPRK